MNNNPFLKIDFQAMADHFHEKFHFVDELDGHHDRDPDGMEFLINSLKIVAYFGEDKTNVWVEHRTDNTLRSKGSFRTFTSWDETDQYITRLGRFLNSTNISYSIVPDEGSDTGREFMEFLNDGRGSVQKVIDRYPSVKINE